MTDQNEIELLPANEVRRRVPMSEATLSRWVKAGLFPAPIKGDGKRFWRRDEIVAWIEEKSAARSPA